MYCTSVNMPLRSYIVAIDRLTVLYIVCIYYGKWATAKPFAWKHFPKWCHAMPKSLFTLIQDHLIVLKFLWLHNHHSICMYVYIQCGCLIHSLYTWPQQHIYLGYGPPHCTMYIILNTTSINAYIAVLRNSSRAKVRFPEIHQWGGGGDWYKISNFCRI